MMKTKMMPTRTPATATSLAKQKMDKGNSIKKTPVFNESSKDFYHDLSKATLASAKIKSTISCPKKRMSLKAGKSVII